MLLVNEGGDIIFRTIVSYFSLPWMDPAPATWSQTACWDCISHPIPRRVVEMIHQLAAKKMVSDLMTIITWN